MTYFGSKSRIAKYIVPIIQKEIDDNDIHFYIEPFCGGLNVIDKIKCDRKFAFDINKYLIYLFIHIKSDGQLPNEITKETYDKARIAWYKDNIDKEFEDWELGCIGHLCSFGGRGFDGGYGVKSSEKLKDGTIKYRNQYQERKRNLLKQFEQPLCQDIMFGIGDYKDLVNLNDYVIYADPPYQNTKQFANSHNFDYEEFWSVMREWSQNNIVLISELSAPDDFECIWEQEVDRSVKAGDHKRAVEKLFKYRR